MLSSSQTFFFSFLRSQCARTKIKIAGHLFSRNAPDKLLKKKEGKSVHVRTDYLFLEEQIQIPDRTDYYLLYFY